MIELIVIGLGILFAVVTWAEWRLWTNYVSNREESLLWAVRTAVARNVSLPDALLGVAPTFRGRYASKVMALATMIERGIALPDALAATPGLVGDTGRFLLAAGRSDGALRDLVPQVMELQSARRLLSDAIVGRLAYLAMLLFVLFNVAAFVSFYIAPKYKAIFGDFGITLPGVTTAVVEMEYSILPWIVMIVGVICFLGIAAVCIRWLLAIFGFASFDFTAPGSWLIGSRRSETLRAVAAQINEGEPVDRMLGELAKHMHSSSIRNGLLRSQSWVRSGKSLADALHAGGLIGRRDAAVLTAAQSAGNLPWAMRQLAQTKDRRSMFRVQLAIETLFPWVVVFVGLVVGMLAVAYFVPLVKIVAELSR